VVFGGSSVAAAFGSAAAAFGSAAAVRSHRGMAVAAITTVVLPPRAAAVAMKTPAATAMAGAQTINNQLKAVTVTATETMTMTATTMTMETKGAAVAAEARQQRGGGGQLGSSGGSLARTQH
jgi:hypothetical protein